MNTRFVLPITIYDHNINTQTNLINGYSSSLILLSLPHKGFLFRSNLDPITEIPSSGLLLDNTTLYYEPISDEFSESVYTTINVTLENSYGRSHVKRISIFVDWVNSPPIILNKTLTLSTHQSLTIPIDVIDVDNDTVYTRVLSVSPSCSLNHPLIIQELFITIQYEGRSIPALNDTCSILFVVGDLHGLESAPGEYTFIITNQLQPSVTSVHINQGDNRTVLQSDFNTTFVVLNNTQKGMIVPTNNTLFYYSDPSFFSDPSTDIHGNALNNPHQHVEYSILHKGILSPVYSLQLIIHHINTPPKYFHFYSINVDSFFLSQYHLMCILLFLFIQYKYRILIGTLNSVLFKSQQSQDSFSLIQVFLNGKKEIMEKVWTIIK